MPAVLLYILFFCSGVSGLIYQVVWVREFGAVFGNTIGSSSIVIAIVMLGLGLGSHAAGRVADRRYVSAPDSLLRSYAAAELLIAALALAVAIVLPRLGPLAARSSAYVGSAHGWLVLSPLSYAVRVASAIVVLGPVALLMGATLTLLVRHFVRGDVETAGGWKIAVLYGVNTLGAAAGAFLTDHLLIPVAGLRTTQLAAVALNLVAGTGAMALAIRGARVHIAQAASTPPETTGRQTPAIWWACAALALSGFSAMGMEIVWLRHVTLLLGSFRPVFSLLVTVVLLGIGTGAMLGMCSTRASSRPAETFMLLLALFVCAVLGGMALVRFQPAAEISLSWADDVWHNLRPILLEAGLPCVLVGASFPLGNAVVQHAESAVGRRAGALYLANTLGAVTGTLVAGFALLPALGMQNSAALLAAAAAIAIVPLALTRPIAGTASTLAVALTLAAGALGAWVRLPSDYVVRRALSPMAPGERSLTLSEGVNEIIEVRESSGRGRGLITNGHPMSSTAWLDQRYMRALAHVPLLSMDRPARVLVIGFGVGNSTHAASLHTSVRRIDVVDLSRRVLEHAGYFTDVNGGVLDDPRVRVYVNDGRQHLQMAPPGEYDLITLEPPPIAQAGVGALYSREFYELARTRLRAGGYLSQWLPAYQVPAPTSLSMVRAFVDVFPRAVLLSGMGPELLLLGTTGGAIHIDPDAVARALEREPAVRTDLARLDLGTPTEIAGMFVGSADTLARATRDAAPESDDRPIQEYSVRSVASVTGGVPSSLFDMSALSSWCPRCVEGGRPSPSVPRLDVYLALLDAAYRGGAGASSPGGRLLLGSRYLGVVVPDTDVVHNAIGVAFLRERRLDEAMRSFREALARNGNSVEANRNMATALSESGRPDDAVGYLRRAVDASPGSGSLQYELGRLLLDRGRFAEASERLRAALRSMPASSSLHNDLGVALASSGDLRDAIEQFRQAVALDPGFAEARRNLASAERATAGSSGGSGRSSS